MIPRVYIVDDEAPARARLKILLSDIESECPHVIAGEASHAQAALEGIAAARPDIILLDVQMPGMNGLELAARVSGTPAGGPAIIFISAYDDYALKAFDVHAFDYLVKPVRAERLAAAIRRVCVLNARAGVPDAGLQTTRRHFSV